MIPLLQYSSVSRVGLVLAQGLDGRGAQTELREDLRPVLQVAHQRATPCFIVQLVRHDDCVARLKYLRLDAAVAEETSTVIGACDGTVRTQDEHVRLVCGLVEAGQAHIVARGAAWLPQEPVVVQDGAGNG